MRLRGFAREDAHAHARFYADPEITRHLPGGPIPEDQAGERSRRARESFIVHWAEHGFGVWAVQHRGAGTLIGQCGLKVLPESREVEVLYLLDRPYWGQGLAAEAAWAALSYGFERVGLQRIAAVTRPEHKASRRVMEKIGMKYDSDVEAYGLRAVCYAITRDRFLPTS